MGVTVVLSKDDYLSNAVAKSLAATFDDVKILRWFSNDEGDFINSLVASSITIEVGPIPQGVLDAKAFFRAKEIIKWVLKILDTQKFCTKEIECYDIFDIVKFPRENGELKAMIHPKLLNFDYKKLYRGYPIFLTFENEEIFFNQESAYAVFINEAAYYEKDIAFCLTKKTKI
jgi:aspartoacylase